MYRFLILVFLFQSVLFAATEQEAWNRYKNLESLVSTKQALFPKDRQKLFDEASRHPVAALSKVPKYDPDGAIGFCFGRAMAVHLLARKKGLGENSIRKLFAIGDLRQGESPEWRFHVTTLVLGEDKEWYAIDPIMEFPIGNGTPLKASEWIRTVQNTWDKNKQAYFYVVDPSTIIPDLRDVPDLDKETGKNLIEVSFSPLHKQGFLESVFGTFRVFQTQIQTQYTYFTNVNEPNENDRFQFLGIRINGQVYDYRNYFVDLLNSLGNE